MKMFVIEAKKGVEVEIESCTNPGLKKDPLLIPI